MNATIVDARLHATIQRAISVTARRGRLERLIHESNHPVRLLHGQPARVNLFTQAHRLTAIVVAKKITASEVSEIRAAENIIVIETAEIRVAREVSHHVTKRPIVFVKQDTTVRLIDSLGFCCYCVYILSNLSCAHGVCCGYLRAS